MPAASAENPAVSEGATARNPTVREGCNMSGVVARFCTLSYGQVSPSTE